MSKSEVSDGDHALHASYLVGYYNGKDESKARIASLEAALREIRDGLPVAITQAAPYGRAGGGVVASYVRQKIDAALATGPAPEQQ